MPTATAPLTSTPILIVKLGDTLPELKANLGDFEHWIAQGLQAEDAPVHIEVADPRPAPLGHTEPPPSGSAHHPTQPTPLPDPTTVVQRRMGVVVTGSHAMVTDREPWSETTAAWLAKLVALGVPVLGICYGHQLLAHALGGEVGYHPQGLEAGTICVEPTAHAASDPLLGHLGTTPFAAPSAHRQSVHRLPPGATVLARNHFEAHHAFRVGECAWGVQFHPEFGPDATRTYVRHLADTLHSQGVDAQALADAVAPSPEAARVLARFAHWVAQRA
ncbi:MAG: GMP synthase [Polaromonas sp.]|nr:GMP synthase [Polaromonas sp.]